MSNNTDFGDTVNSAQTYPQSETTQATAGAPTPQGTSTDGSAASGSTESGYTTAPATSGVGSQPAPSSNSYEAASASTQTESNGSKVAGMGEDFGRGIKGVFAGIHGAGESLRGGFNAAVDQAFGHESGVAKNSAIAREGEREIQTGSFTNSHQG